MGCFHSTSRTAEDAAPDRSGDSGRTDGHTPVRPVERTHVAGRRDGTNTSSIAAPSTRQLLSRPANTTLRPARPWRAEGSTSSTDRPRHIRGPWTARWLRRERPIFFDTRVTGRPEVWQAVQLAVEMARESGDLDGAYNVLDAAGCTVSNRRLEDGIWDDSGVLYRCPQWVVSNPVDVDMDAADDDDDEAGDNAGLDDNDSVDIKGHDDKEAKLAEATAEKEQDELEQRRSEKGKGRGRDLMKIRARLSDRGTDIIVSVEKEQSVRQLTRVLKDKAGIAAAVKVRVLYLGKILRESESLEKQGWTSGHVLNVFVYQP